MTALGSRMTDPQYPSYLNTVLLTLFLCWCLFSDPQSLLSDNHCCVTVSANTHVVHFGYFMFCLGTAGLWSNTFRITILVSMAVKILSINVKGLNSPFKRSMLWKEAKSQKADVLCAQETHFKASSPLRLHDRNFPHIFLSSSETKKSPDSC